MTLMSFFGSRDRKAATAHRRPRAFRPGLQPALESLESRVVLSHAGAPEIAVPAIVGDVLKGVSNNVVINDLQLEGINFDAATGLLTATGGTVSGVLAGLPFTTKITDFALQLVPDDPATPGVECSILDLELAPINLNLLGLHVDTSPICLSITAFEGQGLLGDLLCGLAGGDGLLTNLDGTLGLTDGVLSGLSDGLGQILAQALSQAQPGGGGGDDSVCSGDCEILDLSLGPVDLNLLGVNVHLDDCNDGPVQVCVSATAGEGLLGGLLCGLTDTPTLPIPGLDLDNLDLKDVTKLVTRATNLLADGELSAKDIDKLSDQLVRALRK